MTGNQSQEYLSHSAGALEIRFNYRPWDCVTNWEYVMRADVNLLANKE